MKKKTRYKNFEEKLENTDKKLCEFKSIIDQLKEHVEEMASDEICPDEIEGNKEAQKMLEKFISQMMLSKSLEKGEA